MALLALGQRALSLCTTLLREQLGFRVNSMILEKALTLDLEHFEDSEFYDRMTRARREASARPLSLVMRSFSLAQNLISLVSYAVLLFHFSPWAVALLLVAGLPGFVAETRFSNQAFQLFRWRSAERRQQAYLETVIAREDHAKEVKLYGLGQRLLERYKAIHRALFAQERKLAIRRDSWGFALGLVATAGAVWRLLLGCRQRRARHHHHWPDDHVPAAVPPGPGGGERGAGRDQRAVRGQPVSVDAV